MRHGRVIMISFQYTPKTGFLRLCNIPRRIGDERDSPIIRPSTCILRKYSVLWQQRPVVFQTRITFFLCKSSLLAHNEFSTNRVLIIIITKILKRFIILQTSLASVTMCMELFAYVFEDVSWAGKISITRRK